MLKRNWIWSFFAACGVHAAIIAGWNLVLARPAVFGMASFENSLEVNLVAAPPPETPAAPSCPVIEPVQKPAVDLPALPEEPAVTQTSKVALESSISSQEPIQSQLSKPELPKPVLAQSDAIVGDGSSPQPGVDSHTLQLTGPVRVQQKPGYLSNPPPRYPAKARRLGQEGIVILTVDVDREGRPELVKIKTGSKFELLDEAAVEAVRHWRFRPCQVGGIAVASQVEVPIRFRLE